MKYSPGQRVVLDGALVNVISETDQHRVRVAFDGDDRGVQVYDYQLRTRASAVVHAQSVLSTIAADLGVDTLPGLAGWALELADRADAADAVVGISPRSELVRGVPESLEREDCFYRAHPRSLNDAATS